MEMKMVVPKAFQRDVQREAQTGLMMALLMVSQTAQKREDLKVAQRAGQKALLKAAQMAA